MPLDPAKRKEAQRRYSASEKGQARRRRYEASEKGRARHRRYNASGKGLARARRHEATPRRAMLRGGYDVERQHRAVTARSARVLRGSPGARAVLENGGLGDIIASILQESTGPIPGPGMPDIESKQAGN